MLLHSPVTNDSDGGHRAFAAECPRMFPGDGYCCCTLDLSFRRQTIRDQTRDTLRKIRPATSKVRYGYRMCPEEDFVG